VKTFATVTGFEIALDQITYITYEEGKQKICTRNTAFAGRPLYEVSEEVAKEIRAMFSKQAERFEAKQAVK